jgi:hypothetical protein
MAIGGWGSATVYANKALFDRISRCAAFDSQIGLIEPREFGNGIWSALAISPQLPRQYDGVYDIIVKGSKILLKKECDV